jgi:hypothetical protein
MPKLSAITQKPTYVIYLIIGICFLFSGISQPFAQSLELGVSSAEFTLPVVLSQEMTIESLDLEISGYDPALIETTEVTFAGGILEAKGYGLMDNSTESAVSLVMYAQSEIITGQGKLLYVSFHIKQQGEISLSLTRLEINEASVPGGFEVSGSIAPTVIIVMNHAPVLDNTLSPALTPIPEDTLLPQGDTVADILADGSVTDADGTAPDAMAVVNVDNTHGKWEYSLNNGSAWTPFVADTGTSADISDQARLLDSSHKIRFIPNLDWNGTTTFAFQAWDKTGGTSGMTADATLRGWIYPFSLEKDTASIRVTPVNDAPILDDTFSPVLCGILENQTESGGTPVADIMVDGSVTEKDGNPTEAMAVMAVDNTHGIWQYSLDNGETWLSFSQVQGDLALLPEARLLDGTLEGEDTQKIRFVPDADWHGMAEFTFCAWTRPAAFPEKPQTPP